MVLSNGWHLSEKTISAKHGTTAAGLSPNTMIPSLRTWAPTDQTLIIPNYVPQQWYQLPPLEAIQNNRKRRIGEGEGPGVRTCIRSGGQSKKPRHSSELQKMVVMEVFKQRKRHRRQKSREYKKRINRLERKTHKNEERLEKQEERIGEVYNWVVPRVVRSSAEEILDWATLQGLLYKPDGESHEESDKESSEEPSEEPDEESDEEFDD